MDRGPEEELSGYETEGAISVTDDTSVSIGTSLSFEIYSSKFAKLQEMSKLTEDQNLSQTGKTRMGLVFREKESEQDAACSVADTDLRKEILADGGS